MSAHFFLYIDTRVNMKDFTVYSKYETFTNQLSNNELEVVIRPMKASNKDVYNSQFYCELCKNCYKPNDEEMLIKYKDKVIALLYTPCVDHYQKQYIVCVLFVNAETHKLLGKQCYKEAVNPMCISNANIKDIISEMKMHEEDMVEA